MTETSLPAKVRLGSGAMTWLEAAAMWDLAAVQASRKDATLRRARAEGSCSKAMRPVLWSSKR